MRLVLTETLCALALAARSGGNREDGGPRMLIGTEEDEIAVDVEVADSDEE